MFIFQLIGGLIIIGAGFAFLYYVIRLKKEDQEKFANQAGNAYADSIIAAILLLIIVGLLGFLPFKVVKVLSAIAAILVVVLGVYILVV